MVVVVKKQLCTCRLRAGVVPGRGQRLPLLCSVCTCNCSCGVLCLCSSCFSCHYGSNQPSKTAQHPQQAFINYSNNQHYSEPSSTTTVHSCITLSFITKTSIFLPPSCCLLGVGCLSGPWSELSPSSFGKGAGWECPVATGSGEKERVGMSGLPSLY